MEEISKIPTLCKIAMQSSLCLGLPTALLRVCLFKYELHKERAAHVHDKLKHSPLLSSRCHYLGTKIEGTGKK